MPSGATATPSVSTTPPSKTFSSFASGGTMLLPPPCDPAGGAARTGAAGGKRQRGGRGGGPRGPPGRRRGERAKGGRGTDARAVLLEWCVSSRGVSGATPAAWMGNSFVPRRRQIGPQRRVAARRGQHRAQAADEQAGVHAQ